MAAAILSTIFSIHLRHGREACWRRWDKEGQSGMDFLCDHLWWWIAVVNLIKTKNAWGRSLWICLWGLSWLLWGKKTCHCGWYPSAVDFGLDKMEKVSWAWGCNHCSPGQIGEVNWPTASSSCSAELSAMTVLRTHRENKISFFSCVCPSV